MAKSKFYVVWVGKAPGIYTTWAECQEQTNGFPQAKFKSYESAAEASKAYEAGWKKSLVFKEAAGSAKSSLVERAAAGQGAGSDEIDYDSISVDVGCSGNPGIVEYKGVDTRTGDVLFSKDPIPKGTNNLGEFLAIVHGLAYLKKLGSSKTIYSDSRTAISWVRKKQVASSLVRDESTKEIWALVDRAMLWLQSNSYPNRILKWDTPRWGEIKADYGRK